MRLSKEGESKEINPTNVDVSPSWGKSTKESLLERILVLLQELKSNWLAIYTSHISTPCSKKDKKGMERKANPLKEREDQVDLT